MSLGLDYEGGEITVKTDDGDTVTFVVDEIRVGDDTTAFDSLEELQQAIEQAQTDANELDLQDQGTQLTDPKPEAINFDQNFAITFDPQNSEGNVAHVSSELLELRDDGNLKEIDTLDFRENLVVTVDQNAGKLKAIDTNLDLSVAGNSVDVSGIDFQGDWEQNVNGDTLELESASTAEFQDDGTVLNATTINFTDGIGINVDEANGVAEIFVTGGGGGGLDIQSEGVTQDNITGLNFTDNIAFTVSDNVAEIASNVLEIRYGNSEQVGIEILDFDANDFAIETKGNNNERLVIKSDLDIPEPIDIYKDKNDTGAAGISFNTDDFNVNSYVEGEQTQGQTNVAIETTTEELAIQNSGSDLTDVTTLNFDSNIVVEVDGETAVINASSDIEPIEVRENGEQIGVSVLDFADLIDVETSTDATGNKIGTVTGTDTHIKLQDKDQNALSNDTLEFGGRLTTNEVNRTETVDGESQTYTVTQLDVDDFLQEYIKDGGNQVTTDEISYIDFGNRINATQNGNAIVVDANILDVFDDLTELDVTNLNFTGEELEVKTKSDDSNIPEDTVNVSINQDLFLNNLDVYDAHPSIPVENAQYLDFGPNIQATSTTKDSDKGVLVELTGSIDDEEDQEVTVGRGGNIIFTDTGKETSSDTAEFPSEVQIGDYLNLSTVEETYREPPEKISPDSVDIYSGNGGEIRIQKPDGSTNTITINSNIDTVHDMIAVNGILYTAVNNTNTNLEIYAIDISNQSVKGSYTPADDGLDFNDLIAGPTISNDRVFFAAKNPMNPTLVCLDISKETNNSSFGLSRAWQNEYADQSGELVDLEVIESAIDTKAYATFRSTTDSVAGEIVAYNTKDQEVSWTSQIQKSDYNVQKLSKPQLIEEFIVVPLAYDYAGTWGKSILGINRENGTTVWDYEVYPEGNTEDVDTLSGIVGKNGKGYFFTKDELHCINISNEGPVYYEEKWVAQNQNFVPQTPTVFGGEVITPFKDDSSGTDILGFEFYRTTDGNLMGTGSTATDRSVTNTIPTTVDRITAIGEHLYVKHSNFIQQFALFVDSEAGIQRGDHLNEYDVGNTPTFINTNLDPYTADSATWLLTDNHLDYLSGTVGVRVDNDIKPTKWWKNATKELKRFNQLVPVEGLSIDDNGELIQVGVELEAANTSGTFWRFGTLADAGIEFDVIGDTLVFDTYINNPEKKIRELQAGRNINFQRNGDLATITTPTINKVIGEDRRFSGLAAGINTSFDWIEKEPGIKIPSSQWLQDDGEGEWVTESEVPGPAGFIPSANGWDKTLFDQPLKPGRKIEIDVWHFEDGDHGSTGFEHGIFDTNDPSTSWTGLPDIKNIGDRYPDAYIDQQGYGPIRFTIEYRWPSESGAIEVYINGNKEHVEGWSGDTAYIAFLPNHECFDEHTNDHVNRLIDARFYTEIESSGEKPLIVDSQVTSKTSEKYETYGISFSETQFTSQTIEDDGIKSDRPDFAHYELDDEFIITGDGISIISDEEGDEGDVNPELVREQTAGAVSNQYTFETFASVGSDTASRQIDSHTLPLILNTGNKIITRQQQNIGRENDYVIEKVASGEPDEDDTNFDGGSNVGGISEEKINVEFNGPYQASTGEYTQQDTQTINKDIPPRFSVEAVIDENDDYASDESCKHIVKIQLLDDQGAIVDEITDSIIYENTPRKDKINFEYGWDNTSGSSWRVVYGTEGAPKTSYSPNDIDQNISITITPEVGTSSTTWSNTYEFGSDYTIREEKNLGGSPPREAKIQVEFTENDDYGSDATAKHTFALQLLNDSGDVLDQIQTSILLDSGTTPSTKTVEEVGEWAATTGSSWRLVYANQGGINNGNLPMTSQPKSMTIDVLVPSESTGTQRYLPELESGGNRYQGWQTTVSGKSVHEPLHVTEERILVPTITKEDNDHIHAINRNTGEVEWTYRTYGNFDTDHDTLLAEGVKPLLIIPRRSTDNTVFEIVDTTTGETWDTINPAESVFNADDITIGNIALTSVEFPNAEKSVLIFHAEGNPDKIGWITLQNINHNAESGTLTLDAEGITEWETEPAISGSYVVQTKLTSNDKSKTALYHIFRKDVITTKVDGPSEDDYWYQNNIYPVRPYIEENDDGVLFGSLVGVKYGESPPTESTQLENGDGTHTHVYQYNTEDDVVSKINSGNIANLGGNEDRYCIDNNHFVSNGVLTTVVASEYGSHALIMVDLNKWKSIIDTNVDGWLKDKFYIADWLMKETSRKPIRRDARQNISIASGIENGSWYIETDSGGSSLPTAPTKIEQHERMVVDDHEVLVTVDLDLQGELVLEDDADLYILD